MAVKTPEQESESESGVHRHSQNIEVEAEADGLVPSSVNVKSRSSRSSGFVPELTDRPTDPSRAELGLWSAVFRAREAEVMGVIEGESPRVGHLLRSEEWVMVE